MSSLMLTRSSGFLRRHLSRKSLPSRDTKTYEGMLIFCYLEWVFTHQHLVHHYAKRPNVNLLVVLLSLQDLRANVEGSPTEGCPQSVVLVDRPAEVAKLDNVLARVVSTSWRTMFSGLMSLWMILREWISLTASQTCFIMVATLTSGRGSDLRS